MGRSGYYCKSNPVSEYNAIHSWKQCEVCEIKNCNNNCVEFSGKWRWK